MPQEQNLITVKFKAVGDKALTSAINQLAKAQARLEGGTVKYNNAALLGTKSNRLLNNSFATLRSKLLLFNFAMGMGIRQLVGFSRESAKVDSMGRAFNKLLSATENSTLALDKLKRATNGTMSEFHLFQQANNAMILGVSKNSDEMAEMFDIAQRLGRALGRDTASSVESLITGIGRQSRLMLDNIGIIVKSEEAYEAYADDLGVTVEQLTDADKKQAFFNATMESARLKLKDLGVEQLTATDAFDRFDATMSDLSKNIGDVVTPVVVGFLEGTSDFIQKIMESDLETAVRQLQDMGVAVADLKELNDLIAIENATDAFINNNKKIKNAIEGTFLLNENQLKKLGATFEIIETGSIKTGKSISRQTKLLDASAVSADVIKGSIQRIRMENAIYAEQLKEADGDRRETIQNEIQFNTDQISFYVKLLSLILERNVAEERLLGIKEKQTVEDKEGEGALLVLIKEAEKIKVATGYINQLAGALSNAERAGTHMGKAIEDALKRIASQIASKFLLYSLASVFFPSTFAGSAARFAFGLNPAIPQAHTGGYIKDDGKIQRFANGGVIHGEDNVPILAQSGEFVMSRNAVESVGLETMNRINQTGDAGGVTVNVSGNVMTQDFVENDLADAIREAARRGVAFS